MPHFVYIMSSSGGTLYTGVTNDLNRRVQEHKKGIGSKFTKKYNIKKLVFFEEFQYIGDAIDMEKKIKGWSRRKKLKLIRTINEDFIDLAAEE